MPRPPGTRYRWKTTKAGKKIRLAFRNNKVIETKVKGKKAKRVDHKAKKRSKRRG